MRIIFREAGICLKTQYSSLKNCKEFQVGPKIYFKVSLGSFYYFNCKAIWTSFSANIREAFLFQRNQESGFPGKAKPDIVEMKTAGHTKYFNKIPNATNAL